jgi:Na+/melibiose symporter-like transporter
VATLICLYAVPEPATLKGPPMRWRESWQVLVHNRPFRRLIAAYLINGLANGLPATLIIYFVDYVLQDKGNVGPYLFAYFLCGVIAIPLWVRASNTYGKHRTWCAAMIFACLTFATVPLVGAGDTEVYMAICILTGLGFGADLALPASMQADVVDQDTLETGQQRTGLYFALWGMATKLSLALAAGIGFPLLALTGFDPPQETATWPLITLYAVVPIAFKLIAIVIMRRHPLGRDEVARIREQIQKHCG